MLILDADGLIKLHQAGVLELLARHYACAVPRAVYQEAVADAEDKYPDARQIAKIVQALIEVVDVKEVPAELLVNIGAGEREVLALFMDMRATEPTTIISDDGAFLRLLAMQSIPFLSPADMVLTMVQQCVLTPERAKAALYLINPLINPDAYQRTIARLEEG